MVGPSFTNARELSVHELCARLADRVRAERQALGFSQRVFALRCGVPLRTYKRFELGQCDSLSTFLQIVMSFDRAVALELLFPPKPVDITPRSAVTLLDRLVDRVQKN